MTKKQILPDALYTTEEAGELLGLSPLTIQKYIREKLIEGTKIGDKWYRVTGKELLRFVEESKEYRIIPDSWRDQKTNLWMPRADIIQDLKYAVKVINWEWKNQHFPSKEAADYYASVAARKKLLRDSDVEPTAFLQEELIGDFTIQIFQETAPATWERYYCWVYPVVISSKEEKLYKTFYVPMTASSTSAIIKKILGIVKEHIEKNIIKAPDQEEFLFLDNEFQNVITQNQ